MTDFSAYNNRYINRYYKIGYCMDREATYDHKARLPTKNIYFQTWFLRYSIDIIWSSLRTNTKPDQKRFSNSEIFSFPELYLNHPNYHYSM